MNSQKSQECEGFRLIDVDSSYKKIKEFQESQELINLDDSCIQKMAQNDEWIDCLCILEIELKAILLDRVNNISILPQYLRQRLQPFIIFIMNQIVFIQNRMKLQCYLNEILFLVQKLAFKIWKQYPIQSLQFFYLVIPSHVTQFYNSRVSELLIYKSLINQFYYERQVYGIQNQAESYISNSQIQLFYPLQQEILSQRNLAENVLSFSPFLRMQIHYFYKNGGFERINESLSNFTLKHIDALSLLSYFKTNINEKIFTTFFQHINYQQVAFQLCDEDIKNASKETFAKFNAYIANLISFVTSFSEQKAQINLVYMTIYLQCLRCSSLQKRIYGLQSLSNMIDTQGSYIQYSQVTRNFLKFLVDNQVFQDLFGEKTHFELIKRSFPLIKLLYENKSLKREELISILRLARGKHETWINIISTLLQDLAEILNLEDIQILLQNIQSNQIGLDGLNFIKSLGRNKYLNNRQDAQDSNVTDNKYKKQKLTDEDYKVISVGNCEDSKNQCQSDQQNAQQQTTQYEDIKAQIVEYLLNVVHDQHDTIIGETAFEIATQLICRQFTFLRIQYLMNAIQALNLDQAQLPIQNYFNLIKKIIESSYPIEQFSNPDDVLNWMQQQYNLKINFLNLIKREKLKYLYREEKEYLQVIIQCVNFYKFLHKNSKIKQYELQILWKLLVENARCLEERDLFFDWFYEQLNLDYDAMMWLFIKIIKQIPLSQSMLRCLIKLVLYYNQKYKLFKVKYENYQLNNYDLIGLNILWRIFHTHPDLYNQLSEFFIKLLKMDQYPDVLNHLKQQYLDELFSHIQNPTSIQFVLQLLEEFEGYKMIEQEEKIIVTILNKCANALNPKKQEIQLQSNTQVYQAKQFIGKKLNPSMKPEEFDIFCRGSLFKDNKTLKDYKVNEKLTFTVTNKQGFNNDFEPCEQYDLDVHEKVNKILDIVDIQNKNFIISVLKDKNFDVENTIGELIDRGDQLYNEYQQKNLNRAPPPKKIETNTSFSFLISNQYIDQLFNLLNCNNQQLNTKIWSILQMIPSNQEVYQLIEQSQNDWSKLLVVDNKYRLQYHLQILREQLSCDCVEDEDNYRILRYNFIQIGGLQLLLNNLDNPLEILLIIFYIFHMYLNIYAANQLTDNSYLMLLKPKTNDQVMSNFASQDIIQDYQSQSLFKFQIFDIEINWENLLNKLFNWIGIERCYTTILSILFVQPTLLNCQFPINQLLNLLNNPLLEQRKLAANFIVTLNDLGIKFGYNLSVQFLPILIQGQTEYEELFIVIADLIDQTNDVSFLQTQELGLKIINFILNRPIIESPFMENEDKVLQGNLVLLISLLKKDQDLQNNLIDNQFSKYIYECLFEMHNNYLLYPVYKRSNTRKRAFDLLLELSKVQMHLYQILDLIQINQQTRTSSQELNSEFGIKREHGFVGLCNLGATCYINSLLQQLFMNIQFRKGILNGQILIKTELGMQLIITNYANQEQIESLNEHTLFQLQLVFIQLQESVKQYINPNQFIKTLKGFDGQQINPLIQEDCNEFFNLLTGKLEQDLKHTVEQNLIQQSFGGTLVNEIKSLESDCDFSKETEEPFLTVSVEIKNKKSLYEALDLFVKSDVLDGENQYFCDEVQRKIDAEKRCYFTKLPKTFIFHLKRFEFDFNTNTRSKINDYWEFPLELNMFKWTRDNIVEHQQLEDFTEYMYVLKGVLVHTGSAEGGHYFSYIRDGKNQWFEFNDKLITPFDTQNLKEKCFGGNQSNEWGIPNSKNAYMLFYEKEKQANQQKINQNKIEIESEDEDINIEQLRKQVIKQNTQYLENKLLNAQEYVSFVQRLVQVGMESNQIQSLAQLLQLFTIFTFSQFLKNKDIQQFQNSLKILNNSYNQNNSTCVWLLDYFRFNKEMLIHSLIEHQLVEIAQFLNLVIEQAGAYDSSSIQPFFQFYLSELLPIASKNHKNGVYYFEVISYNIDRHEALLNLLMQDGYFHKFYEILIDKLKSNSPSNYLLKEDSMILICEILGKIIRYCQTVGMLSNQDCPTYLHKGSVMFELDQLWIEELFQQNHFRKYILSMVKHQKQLIQMIKHICWNDQGVSNKVIQEILIQILDNDNSWSSLEKIREVLKEILLMEDGLQQTRIILIFSYDQSGESKTARANTLIEIISKDDLDYTIGIICMLAELGFNVVALAEYLNSNKGDYEFLLYKLKDIMTISQRFFYPIVQIRKAIEQLQSIFQTQVEINVEDDNRRQSDEESKCLSTQVQQDLEDTNQISQ
ncbi:unnamed protein product (macronuclear) [Paramecium tetraurelia]|uniref:USP domain-containing protein n=1 Tax=Paramecium tetraurelia TaxID=5888 RepID=A0BJI9_PARTE|nr:uncharacterized protein GSPATT00029334001 [Paramecium tetraurelia]CAK58706.1 unnamed protein product [Paramecium tetraurelia]|eukprot:XP_001426104.1 hypothetical protein (macronuclear) [Paramecium tetraurelia strain d4-2]